MLETLSAHSSNEAPVYGTALRSIPVALVLCELLTVGLGVYYILENKRRDRLLADTLAEVLAISTCAHEEFLDRTDIEDALKFVTDGNKVGLL